MGHLRAHGFTVETRDVDDVTPVKRKHGVPPRLDSCHTGVIDGYVIEGHVPADVIETLLRERSAVAGLAVPGMPIGAPGMEVPGEPPVRYEVLAFDRRGDTRVFARR